MEPNKFLVYDDGVIKIEKTDHFKYRWFPWPKKVWQHFHYKIIENGIFINETQCIKDALNFVNYRKAYNKAPSRIIIVDRHNNFFIAKKSPFVQTYSHLFAYNGVNYAKSPGNKSFSSETEARNYYTNTMILPEEAGDGRKFVAVL